MGESHVQRQRHLGTRRIFSDGTMAAAMVGAVAPPKRRTVDAVAVHQAMSGAASPGPCLAHCNAGGAAKAKICLGPDSTVHARISSCFGRRAKTDGVRSRVRSLSSLEPTTCAETPV